MKTSILNIYFCLTLLIKLAESAMLFLKVQEIKKHMFLFHYGKRKQIGGNRTRKLPLNRGGITYYSIKSSQHKHFYDF